MADLMYCPECVTTVEFLLHSIPVVFRNDCFVAVLHIWDWAGSIRARCQRFRKVERPESSWNYPWTCARGVKTTDLDFTVSYSLREVRYQEIIRLNCTVDMPIEAVIESNKEDIKEFIVDKFQSFYEDAMSQGRVTMNPDGIYIYEDVYDTIYNSAYRYLADHADELEMTLIAPGTSTKTSINVADYLKDVIDSRAHCEASLVEISEAISYDSVDFVENGSWQAGLIPWNGEELVPALWFGRDNATPMRRWTITPYITPVDFSFWFKDADEDMLEAIMDEFDTISVWYLYECGCELPELTGLIQRCPVQFEKDDSPETIREKITSYLLSLQEK